MILRNIVLTLTLICSFAGTAFANATQISRSSNPNDPKVNHFVLQDSAKNKVVNIRAQLVDSLAITNLKNAPTHVDNNMSVRLFLDGHFTDAFQFNAKVFVVNDYTNRFIPDHFFNPDEGLPYVKQSETRRTWDMFSANVSYELSALSLLTGYDYIQWGPARRNNVILRGEKNNYRPWYDESAKINNPAPMPYFGYQLSVGPVVYTQYAMMPTDRKGYSKYLHAHRLDLNLPKNITLGLSETSLYGTTTENVSANPNPNADADSCGRDFQWAYVIPFLMYNFEEHTLGDQDNISMSFDISIRAIPHWEIYGELMWDDMKTPTSMFDDSWWGNKWAASIGIARDSLRLGPAYFDWYTEYTRVEPWVYTHHKGGGYTYSHYRQNLATELGPNSQELYTELTGTYRHRSGLLKDAIARGTLFASAVAKDTAAGGNLTDIHDYEKHGVNKVFLNEATTINYVELGAGIEILPWSWISFHARYSRFFGDYEGYHASMTGSFQW
ncbi:MAG: hypothetical protein MJZ05_08675 [Fibrobacter sp.]|nr:hypothetical protein [Fibrobacter sp.]